MAPGYTFVYTTGADPDSSPCGNGRPGHVDQTRYSFATSALRDTTYSNVNVDLAIGYSKLDYLANYEDDYFGPLFDGGLADGLSFASFDAIPTPVGDLTSGLGLHARIKLQAGWLWMSRIRSLAGLGFYLRPSPGRGRLHHRWPRATERPRAEGRRQRHHRRRLPALLAATRSVARRRRDLVRPSSAAQLGGVARASSS